MSNLNKITKLSDLLKYDAIKEEVDMLLEGYDIIEIDKAKNSTSCILKNEEDDKATLTITNNKISILIRGKKYIDRIIIDDSMFFDEQRIERRKKGYIVTEINKYFEKVKGYDKDYILVSISDNKHLYKKSTMDNIIGTNHGNDLNQIMTLLNKRVKFFKTGSHDALCDKNIYFSTRLDYQKLPFYQYRNRTIIDDEDVTKYYDYIYGYDMINRIYLLYQGISCEKTRNDIYGINEGRISYDAFNLKEARGIDSLIDEIVGKSDEFTDNIKYKK